MAICGLTVSSTFGAAQAGEWHAARRHEAVLTYTAASTGPLLSIECWRGQFSVTVFWHQPMLGRTKQVVTYQIDQQPARVEQWRLSTDGRIVGVWGLSAREMFHRLKGKRRLWIRAPSKRGPVEATFETAGIERALQPVALACRLPR